LKAERSTSEPLENRKVLEWYQDSSVRLRKNIPDYEIDVTTPRLHSAEA
ncbi:hypothetical protein TNCV_2369401, partial [Trichonephila clavipes]